MENQGLQKRQTQGILSTPSNSVQKLSPKGVRILKVIVNVNDCVPFKLDLTDLSNWSQDLERLCSDSELHKLRFLMDCFKTDQIVWDQKKGIQNIFNGLKRINKNEKGEYEIMETIKASMPETYRPA